MKLMSTRVEYEFKDRSGYSFTVVATKDGTRGWSASVAMESSGYVSPEAAVGHLRHATEAFLRQLKAAGMGGETP